jgi:NAD-reducing hydrogenase small subunit
MKKLKLATVWLDGCSGCHMSLLDMDERIIPWRARSTWCTARWWTRRSFPRTWTSRWWKARSARQEDLERLRRSGRSKMVVALGDCAVTGNVPAMRNNIPVNKLLQRIYVEGADAQKAAFPPTGVPRC